LKATLEQIFHAHSSKETREENKLGFVRLLIPNVCATTWLHIPLTSIVVSYMISPTMSLRAKNIILINVTSGM